MNTLVLARLLTVATAMGAMGTVSVAAAEPDTVSCVTEAQVYASSPPAPGIIIRTEVNDINNNPGAIYVDVPTGGGAYPVYVKLGGNGLKSGSTPTWDVYTVFGESYLYTNTGNKTAGNCVANEKTFTFRGAEGDSVLVKANYDGGNTGTSIRNQRHFLVLFY
jgi:hypothetical protein